MPVEVVMPKFGLTMQEGTIEQWFKAVGDAVNKGEPLFEVETEKVLYEVEAPASGRVAQILYPVETTVACAKLVAVIALEGEDLATVAARYADRSATVPLEQSRPAREQQPVPSRRNEKTPPVTPAARKLAKDHGVDLATVNGSGPGGRITREDVEAAVASPPGRTKAPAGGTALHGMRKSIAEHMLKSIQSTAQLTITTEADVTAMGARYRRFKAEHPMTYTDLVVEATAKALREHPHVNATVAGKMIQCHDSINVGVAVALEEGLIVPVIRCVDQKSLLEIAKESRVLAERARAGTLGVDDVSGGTFTVTNLGMYGVDAFTPILLTPQVAILGVGRIVEKPAVHNGAIAVRQMMVLSLTFDHRIIDGAPGAAFLRSIVSYLQVD